MTRLELKSYSSCWRRQIQIRRKSSRRKNESGTNSRDFSRGFAQLLSTTTCLQANIPGRISLRRIRLPHDFPGKRRFASGRVSAGIKIIENILVKQFGMRASMSRRGNCYDNAPTDSFFASLKREMVYRTSFATREEARAALFEWIAVWYNRKRIHSAVGYLSPEQFEQQHQQPEMIRLAA